MSREAIEVMERMLRFVQHLPSGLSRELIILKGHLLIEEVLSDLIKYQLERSNPLGINVDGHMMFNQKLLLCWGMLSDDISDECWIALKQLNVIRNSLSHSLEPKNIDEKIDALIRYVMSNSEFSNDWNEGEELEFSISWMFINLSSCLQRIRFRLVATQP